VGTQLSFAAPVDLEGQFDEKCWRPGSLHVGWLTFL
jgi:hypothetical protein